MKQTFKELFQNKANSETVYNRYNLPKEDRVVLNKVLKEYIDRGNQPVEVYDGRESLESEEPTYLRHTHYITNNATGGYYVEKNGDFELVEFDNATVEVKLDSDYSGNYKEGYALFNVTFPGTDENGYVKNSRPYTYNEELGLITIEGVLQGTGSYSPLTERKDINLKLTNAGRTLQLLNEHVISTTSPNVWTDGLVELQGVEI